MSELRKGSFDSSDRETGVSLLAVFLFFVFFFSQYCPSDGWVVDQRVDNPFFDHADVGLDAFLFLWRKRHGVKF